MTRKCGIPWGQGSGAGKYGCNPRELVQQMNRDVEDMRYAAWVKQNTQRETANE